MRILKPITSISGSMDKIIPVKINRDLSGGLIHGESEIATIGWVNMEAIINLAY